MRCIFPPTSGLQPWLFLGLIAVFIGEKVVTNSPTLAHWLHHADAIAALGVSIIVIYVSFNLGKRTIGCFTGQRPEGNERHHRA